MQKTESCSTVIRSLGLGGILIAALSACGGANPEGESAAAAGPEPAPAPQAAEATAGEESVGTVSFTVDGAEKVFDYLPDAENYYTKLSSAVAALPESGSTERFGITFLSIDLKDYTYPAELPAPKDPSKPMDPMTAMASVGFSYIDADGTEWAGPGKIYVESFDSSGVIMGSFESVTLPHTDDERPDITLTGGAFSVRITSPW